MAVNKGVMKKDDRSFVEASKKVIFDSLDRTSHRWAAPDGDDVRRSARILAGISLLGRQSSLDADDLGRIAEALCQLSLPGGGWGLGGNSAEEDAVDILATATAIHALARYQRWADGDATSVFESRPPILLDRLYADRIVPRLDRIPSTRPLDHTMFEALDVYAEQKLPIDDVKRLLEEGGRIEIHGVYPTHLAGLLENKTMSFVRRLDTATENIAKMSTTKRFNSIRPHFYEGRDLSGQSVLLVAVGVGDDYVAHYATMIRHVVGTLTAHPPLDFLRVVRYPEAERDIAYWTGLDGSFVAERDRVVLGYVEECRERIGGDEATVAKNESEFYGADTILDGKGGRVTFLGVKFSFWGSISAHLVARICELGATEVLYVGKLGALTSPHDLYNRIFAPSSFAKLSHDQVEYFVEPPPPNGILMEMNDLDTGLHVSIPTVLEEDYHQRQVATDLGARSIDNEISQVAWAVANHNKHRNPADAARFSALHFATDYIRAETERTAETDHDLARTRTDSAKAGRQTMLDRIVLGILRPYLSVGDR
jgi:hypothetical protein